jgi:14-3-3 protein
LDYYEETERLSRDLPPTNLIVLGLKLNLSLFYWEILEKKKQAKKIATEAFEDALKNINSVQPQLFEDSSNLMQLLSDNLTLWRMEDNDE